MVNEVTDYPDWVVAGTPLKLYATYGMKTGSNQGTEMRTTCKRKGKSKARGKTEETGVDWRLIEGYQDDTTVLDAKGLKS